MLYYSCLIAAAVDDGLVMTVFCDFFSLFFFHTLDLTLCVDRDVHGVMPEVLRGPLVAQVDQLVSRLMHKHD